MADAPIGVVDVSGITDEELSATSIDLAPDPVSPEEDPTLAAGDELAGELSGDGVSVSSIEFFPNTVNADEDPELQQEEAAAEGTAPSATDIRYSPEELDALAALNGVDAGDGGNIPESALYRLENEQAAEASAFRDKARQQQTIASQRKQINNGDWRVRLRLAPQSKYLYNAPSPGILQPLTVTDGIIFPYTPKIDTSYKANYESYDLTHSNYRGYFYKGSNVDAINLNCTFTAQDTNEANYLLAVITFLKSATKMFYGQDAERGAPPPLVYLTGLGEYQFNEHSCLIQSFNYNLPDNVDYIRASSVTTTNAITTRRDRQSVATQGVFGSLNRLAAAFLTKGAIPAIISPSTLGTNSPTYVPTKMEISLTLLPVQSRQQVSQQFSLKNFANGNLIKGGFW